MAACWILCWQIDSLGQALASLCNVVPAGVVCFFPSYAYLDHVHQRWTATGIAARISKRKKVGLADELL